MACDNELKSEETEPPEYVLIDSHETGVLRAKATSWKSETEQYVEPKQKKGPKRGGKLDG